MPAEFIDVDPSLRANSLVRIRIGNREYDAKFSKTCKVCNNPARMEIETCLIKGDTYRSIAQHFSEAQWTGRDGGLIALPELGWQPIRNHYLSGHMPMSAAALRHIAEERAQQIGAQYEENTARLVDHYTVAKAIVQRGYERMVVGEIEPEIKDTIAAAKLLKEIEDTQIGSVDAEVWSEAMMIYFETAQELMPPQMWTEFTRKLGANPVLRGLAQKMQQHAAIEG